MPFQTLESALPRLKAGAHSMLDGSPVPAFHQHDIQLNFLLKDEIYSANEKNYYF
jgi:hypothetical protein